MKIDWMLAALGVIGSFLVGAILGIGMGRLNATLRLRQEAIEHGAASYVCDPTTGETTFQWKEGK